MYGMIAFGLYLLFVLIRWPLEKRARERRAQREAAPAPGQEDDQRWPSPGGRRAQRPLPRCPGTCPRAPFRPGQGRVEPRL
jgi:hypothetical protein